MQMTPAAGRVWLKLYRAKYYSHICKIRVSLFWIAITVGMGDAARHFHTLNILTSGGTSVKVIEAFFEPVSHPIKPAALA